MSTQIKRRGGTTAQHATFTGANRELTVDTTKHAVVVHDGSTAGGHPQATETYVDNAIGEAFDALTATDVSTSDASTVQTKLTTYASTLSDHTSQLAAIDGYIVATESSNKLNKDAVTTGGYLKTAGGGIQSDASYFISNYIVVENGDVVRYKYDAAVGNGQALFLYNSDKTYLANVLGALDGTSMYRSVTLSNASVAYVRVSYHTARLATAMVTVNVDYPAAFVAYSFTRKMSDEFRLNTAQLAQVPSNPLYGKILSLSGDSIAYGAGYTGGYGKIIGGRNSMTVENKAVQGATITAGTMKDGIPRHWICRDIVNMRSDADYVILEGGVNDGANSVPIGAVSSGYTAALDDTTFCGAFESMLKAALARYPAKKIGYVLVHYMTYSQNTYNPYIIQMLEKWGIPYINLFKECPPLYFIDALKTAYTLASDGWHPNEAGYRAYYTDKIEAWMKTL